MESKDYLINEFIEACNKYAFFFHEGSIKFKSEGFWNDTSEYNDINGVNVFGVLRMIIEKDEKRKIFLNFEYTTPLGDIISVEQNNGIYVNGL